MRRISTATAVADLFGAGKPGFRDGDKAAGITPTDLNAEYCNALQEEVVNVIEAAALDPSQADLTQLLQAIQALIVDAIPGAPADASTAVKGLIEIATDAEAQALVSALLAITPSGLNASFKGSNQSLATPGYQKFAGGLIMQWGNAPGSTVGNATTNSPSATLPITFPTAGLFAIASFIGPQGGCAIGCGVPSLTSITVSYANLSGATQTLQGKYLAVGW